MKKKMYYQMKQKTLERGYNETVKKLEEKKENVKTVSTNVLKKLNFAIKEVRGNRLITLSPSNRYHPSPTRLH